MIRGYFHSIQFKNQIIFFFFSNYFHPSWFFIENSVMYRIENWRITMIIIFFSARKKIGFKIREKFFSQIIFHFSKSKLKICRKMIDQFSSQIDRLWNDKIIAWSIDQSIMNLIHSLVWVSINIIFFIGQTNEKSKKPHWIFPSSAAEKVFSSNFVL